jgi:hypothetical protein
MGSNLRAGRTDLKLPGRFPVDSGARLAGLGSSKSFLRMLIGW